MITLNPLKKAVKWGRNVFDSIRKFVQFQVTVNIVAVTVAFVGAITEGESPLKSIQLLWVNLIMDTMAALALATEHPSAAVMNRNPEGRNTNILTPKMWRLIVVEALYQLSVLFFTLYAVQYVPKIRAYTLESHNTLVFNAFVFCQVFNEFNCRKLDNELNPFGGIRGNLAFLIIFCVTVVLQFVFVQFGDEFVKTTPLNLYQWLFCVAVGLISLPLGFLLRFIPVPKDRNTKTKQVLEKEPLLISRANSEDLEKGGSNVMTKK